MRLLTTIPGVGAITAATVKALVPDPDGFKSGRHFAAWLGLTPKSIRAAARSGSAAYRKWAIRRCARCSFVAPPRFCDASKARQSAAMANRTFCAAAVQGRRGSARQQDGADHLALLTKAGHIEILARKQRGERLSREKPEWTDRRRRRTRRGAQLDDDSTDESRGERGRPRQCAHSASD